MAGEYNNLQDVIDPQNRPVYKRGDRVKLEFISNPSKWIRASQIAIIEYRLEKNKDIKIISADYWGDETITFDVEVTSTDALMTETAIIGLILSASPAYFMLVHKPAIAKVPAAVAKTVQKVADYAPITIAVVVVIAFLILLRK